ncbi:MAG TPA: DMT family transporter [Gammaproteobacteria bacterium]|nr:DMT family transporter [Gammaproteobacteria bacterium]
MRSENLSGILWMLLATAVLSMMDAVMKQLAAHYSALQVASLRGLVSLPFVIAWVWTRERSFATLVRVRWGWHLIRGVLAICMLGSFVYAISGMPLSEAYTLFFIAPLLITALSVPLLKEKVDGRRWLAILGGFCGVLIVLRPGFNSIGLTALAVLLGATSYALNAISVRHLGKTDSTAAMSFWFMFLLAIGAGLLALPNWQPLRWADAGWLAALGITGAIGQLCLTEAFRRAPVSVVAPFEYSALFWGVLLDLLLWGDVPGPIVWLGAAVIVGSGLYLLQRERVVQPVTPP